MTKPIKKAIKAPPAHASDKEHRIVYANHERVMKMLERTMLRHKSVLDELDKC